MSSIEDRYSAVIIGAGPAGLAAAIGLLRAGISSFILIERDTHTGGILNQCIHNGFGLKYYHEDLTGPEFARRLEAELQQELDRLRQENSETDKVPTILCGAMVAELTKSGHHNRRFSVRIHSKAHGILTIEADTVITATGCRERTRENIEVPGARPAGVFTAGQAQNLINLRHYKTGSCVVIQGSGDIGLIMARRLTLEGFKVAAVLERLPYLSGSIRNKVQCLDHFGIPLHLGTHICDIRGRARVSSVLTQAVDDSFQPIEGGELEFECDTVLFAAGLIPELEAVKPAGVELPDRFRPAVNGLFETNAEGLFAAGNCLHINDLADSAAEEGFRAAAAVADYLADAAAFRLRAKDAAERKPYTNPLPQTELNDAYFQRLRDEELTVCIVCPKGCLLSEGNYGCRRGEEYFNRTKSGTQGIRQRIHTTVEIIDDTGNEDKVIVPAVSIDEVPVEYAAALIAELKKTSIETVISTDSGTAADMTKIKAGRSLDSSGDGYVFRLCKQVPIDL